MVTDLVLNVVSTFVSWFLSLMPVVSYPTYLTGTGSGTLNGTLTGAVSVLWSFDAFIPVTQLVLAAALVLAALVVGVGVRVVRIIASYLTLGGGM